MAKQVGGGSMFGDLMSNMENTINKVDGKTVNGKINIQETSATKQTINDVSTLVGNLDKIKGKQELGISAKTSNNELNATVKEIEAVAKAWTNVNKAIKRNKGRELGNNVKQETKQSVDQILNSINKIRSSSESQLLPFNTTKLLLDLKDALLMTTKIKEVQSGWSINKGSYNEGEIRQQVEKINELLKSPLEQFNKKSTSDRIATRMNEIIKGSVDSVKKSAEQTGQAIADNVAKGISENKNRINKAIDDAVFKGTKKSAIKSSEQAKLARQAIISGFSERDKKRLAGESTKSYITDASTRANFTPYVDKRKVAEEARFKELLAEEHRAMSPEGLKEQAEMMKQLADEEKMYAKLRQNEERKVREEANETNRALNERYKFYEKIGQARDKAENNRNKEANAWDSKQAAAINREQARQYLQRQKEEEALNKQIEKEQQNRPLTDAKLAGKMQSLLEYEEHLKNLGILSTETKVKIDELWVELEKSQQTQNFSLYDQLFKNLQGEMKNTIKTQEDYLAEQKKIQLAATQNAEKQKQEEITDTLNKQKEIYKQVWEERLIQEKATTNDEINDSKAREERLMKELGAVTKIVQGYDEISKRSSANNLLGIQSTYGLKVERARSASMGKVEANMVKDRERVLQEEQKIRSAMQKNEEKASADREAQAVAKVVKLYADLKKNQDAQRTATGGRLNELEREEAIIRNNLNNERDRLKALNSEEASIRAASEAMKIYEQYSNKAKQDASLTNKIVGSYGKADKIQAGSIGMAGRYEGVDAEFEKLEQVKLSLENIFGKAKQLSELPLGERINAEKEINAEYAKEKQNLADIIKNINSIKRDPDKKYVDETTISKQIAQMEDFYSKNDGASKRMLEQLRGVIDETQKLAQAGHALPKDFDPLVTKFNQIKTEMKRTGDTGMSIMSKLGRAWRSQMASQIAMYTSFYSLIRYAHEAFNTIRELDTAMIDLSKTTKMSASEMGQFYYDANEAAKEYGVTTKELIDMASQWSRLGYNDKESSTEMAKMSAQFKMISPGMDVQQSMDGLVSSMKAFGIEVGNVEQEIMDKINIVGRIMPKRMVTYGIVITI